MRGAAVAIVAAATLTAAAAYGYWTVRSTTVRDHPVATATPTRKAPHLPRPSFLIPTPTPSQISPPAPTGASDADSRLTIAAKQTGITWAATESPHIGPGTQTYTGTGQCTANFVFTDDAHNVYVGQAAHCASTGTSKDTNGCTSVSRPLGTPVTFNRGGRPMSPGEVVGGGELVYSSWLTMQNNHEQDSNTCAYNDFALVKADMTTTTEVNPTLPYWGGPSGINTTGLPQGTTVHSYGNSSLRFGAAPLSPQTGTAQAPDPSAAGWMHSLTSHTPGIPGDSGSAYLDSAGKALGTLSTLGLGIPIINNIGDIAHELAYAQEHSGISGLRLVLGTAGFTPSR
ncbi:hypothetical protein [Mycobacteroides abscessus]|uniref:hypothetical protein n=1 Tax=Mycobacteroides abscessus TaxID=36809 RepID=UPI0009A5DE07|nr:hypothetical protein [Mycobacteroides abscessus]SKI12749.1 Uncharacterised protein [Mycobacteroides abscessus subsp. massiliense]SKM19727.1 Uncharacterised protein [Mycobacteroides abscessus subsp. massiliense]SLD62244.1 Uncharacterised protein [Mycobacteroides abscessus subsp. massiliense]SLD89327.1 Uncharacterised protein [Mycobacteroides abscessus subsp. massiliense]SLG14034.1 Uncharacterised protein [Mycobacteroides abscessus subsp. massiliense]